MNKQLILIKLGGSIITDKSTENTLRKKILKSLVKEVKKVKENLPQIQFIIGHGHGSFGHTALKKYQLTDNTTQNDVYGSAVTLDLVAYLNQIVTHEFIEQGIPAFSARVNNLLTVEDQPQQLGMQTIDLALRLGFMPIFCGDVIFSPHHITRVWSTELVFDFLVGYYLKKNWSIKKIIHIGEVEGFLDSQQQLIPEITPHSWSDLQKNLRITQGIDMTGGMKLKIEESLKLCHQGIDTHIISGLRAQNLSELLLEDKLRGTHIHA